MVLSGTPLENKLDELYSVMEFVDQYCLGPYYKFMDDATVKDESGKILSYRNLNKIGERISKRLLRRRDAMKALQIRHAELLQIRDLQRIEMRRDVAEGICPRITERRGIRHRPNPQRIDYNRKYSSIFLRVHTHTSFDRQVATPENQGLTIHSDYSRCDADAQ